MKAKIIFCVTLLPFFCSGCASLNVPSFDAAQAVRLEDDERRLWQRSEEEEERISEGKFLYEDTALTEYINGVLRKVTPPEILAIGLRCEAKVIKDPRLNAFCYPDGVIYVHTGILARMDNEAQLATLLGHEITHAIKRHVVKQFRGIKNKTAFMSTLQVTTGGIGGGVGELVGALGQLGAIGAFYGYSRDLEREADACGFERMLKAGYDINEAPKLFEHLKEDFDKEKIPDPFFFSSHPRLKERIKSYNELTHSFYAKEAESNTRQKNEQVFLAQTKRLLLDNADMDLALGRIETARVTVEKYISRFPTNAEGYFYLGKVYTEKFCQPVNKKLKESLSKEEIKQKAVQNYKKAIDIDPGYPLSYRALGMVYFKAGEKQGAQKCFARFIELCQNEKEKAYVQNYLKECSK